MNQRKKNTQWKISMTVETCGLGKLSIRKQRETAAKASYLVKTCRCSRELFHLSERNKAATGTTPAQPLGPQLGAASASI